ncbi:PrpR N-terminal domain-containing protein [Planococcus sp. N028]|uniref:PrpR N-terminal domain-containing protein n=1 Tax=Planococcus shixiaomingii TaxID=3058393 RepID=A0ABT8N491_9BACL|nr:sigma-54-dependent transcriptional regulator [Planococcus sp. N028]MDN7242711.1 PrpR N-terminal domain-containing protein [Planococcus sp. N028]
MRKISIGFISPYEAMVPMIEDLKRDHADLEINAKVGNLEKGVELAREMEQQGTDVIISRGGTAKLIREAVEVPVIDVHMSGYDLLRSIMLASGHSKEKKALVGFSNITLGAESIVSLLEIDMEVVTIAEASEVEPILLKLKTTGYTQILGDVVTVNVATQLGLNGLLIQSGREAILESLEEARYLFTSQQKNQQLLRIMRQLLKEREQDVLITSDKGKVLFENWTSFEQAPLSEEKMQALYEQAAIHNLPVIEMFHDGQQSFSVRADLIADRDGKIVSFFFKSLSSSKHKLNQITVEKINQVPSLVAESAEMKTIKHLLEEPLLSSESIVLVGEPGTGKETLARYVHSHHKKEGAFAVLPIEELNESLEEIFSHQFSTVVLKFSTHTENVEIQKVRKQLTLLKEKGVQVILTAPVSPGEWIEKLDMQDAIVISVPNLNERKEDMAFLVRQFLTELHQTIGTQPVKIRDDAMRELEKFQWGGNLDELKAYVKKLAISEKGYVIEKSTLLKIHPDSTRRFEEGKLAIGKEETLKKIEQKVIEQVLKDEQFNQTKAAKRLGINRATLWRKLKQ